MLGFRSDQGPSLCFPDLSVTVHASVHVCVHSESVQVPEDERRKVGYRERSSISCRTGLWMVIMARGSVLLIDLPFLPGSQFKNEQFTLSTGKNPHTAMNL